jgi:hypothetical protein
LLCEKTEERKEGGRIEEKGCGTVKEEKEIKGGRERRERMKRESNAEGGGEGWERERERERERDLNDDTDGGSRAGKSLPRKASHGLHHHLPFSCTPTHAPAPLEETCEWAFDTSSPTVHVCALNLKPYFLNPQP